MPESNNYFQLLLSLGVDNASSKANIQKYIASLKDLDSIKVDLDIANSNKSFSDAEKQIKVLQDQIKTLKQELNGVGNQRLSAKGIESFTSQIGSSIKSVADLQNAVKKLNGEFTLDFAKITNADGLKENLLKSFSTTITDIDGSLRKVQFKPTFDSSGFLTGVEEVRNKITQLDFKNFDAKADKTSQLLRELGRQGNISAEGIALFDQRLENIKVAKSVSELERLNNEIRELNKEASADLKIKNAIDSILPSVDRLNEKLTLTVNKLGDNVDTSSLDKIKNDLLAISNTEIKTVNDIANLNNQIYNTDRAITQLNQSASNLSRFDEYVAKVNRELTKLERSGYASSETINGFRNSLNNIPTGDLSKVKTLLGQIGTEIDDIQRKNMIDKQLTNATNELAKMNARLEKTKALYAGTFNKSAAQGFTSQIVGIDSEITKLKNKGTAVTQKDVDDITNAITQGNIALNTFNAQATTAVRNSQGIGGALRTAFEKFPIWMVASTAFYGTARAIRDITDKVIELDSALINLQRVSEGEAFQFANVIPTAIENVDALSGKLNEYLEIYNEFARAGNTLDESFDLANTTQVLNNISDLDANESVDALIGSMTNFNFTAEESIRIADRLNEVNKTALHNSDIMSNTEYRGKPYFTNMVIAEA